MSVSSRYPVIEVTGLGKNVASPDGELVILHDINLTILSAEAVAIVGASGSGKSTLLGLMAGLDMPTSGSVKIQGRDLFALDEDGRAEVRRNLIGFVFQSFQLLPNLTALENVMLPVELSGQQRQARDTASGILDRVGLASRLHHYPRQMSGGEQQRVAIARAFAAQPALLFADEPTGNLDQRTGDRIIDLLFDINHERATTLVLVTHDESLSARCNRSLHLDAGRLLRE
jgi:putative ABC transport system ATP-binding protein